MDKKEIGMKLKEMRISNNFTAEYVSNLLESQFSININLKTLYGYESGRTSPDVDCFLALCVIYGSTDVLFDFGYVSAKNQRKVKNPEIDEIIEKYQSLPEDSKDMIRGALGIEKRDSEQMKGIS